MTFVRIVRSCSSVVRARAKERRAVFVALYVLYKKNPFGPVHFIGISFALLVGFLLQLHLHPFCVRLTTLVRTESQLMHGRSASGLSERTPRERKGLSSPRHIRHPRSKHGHSPTPRPPFPHQDERNYETSCWNSSIAVQEFLERHMHMSTCHWRTLEHTKGLHDEFDHRHFD